MAKLEKKEQKKRAKEIAGHEHEHEAAPEHEEKETSK
jgi:hypothetical protein